MTNEERKAEIIKLVTLLGVIKEDPKVSEVEYLHQCEYFNTTYKEEVESLAEAMITGSGVADVIRNFMGQVGFPVFPGETDSCGWLTGCIRIPTKGIAVFG